MKNKLLFICFFMIVLLFIGGSLFSKDADPIHANENKDIVLDKNQLITEELMTKAELKIGNSIHQPGEDNEKGIDNSSVTALELHLEFSFPNKIYEEGEYYETTLPDVFRIEALSGEFPREKASYSYDPTTRKLRIFFNEKTDGSLIDVWQIDIVASFEQYPLEEKAEKTYSFSYAPEDKYYLRFYDKKTSTRIIVNEQQFLDKDGNKAGSTPHTIKMDVDFNRAQGVLNSTRYPPLIMIPMFKDSSIDRIMEVKNFKTSMTAYEPTIGGIKTGTGISLMEGKDYELVPTKSMLLKEDNFTVFYEIKWTETGLAKGINRHILHFVGSYDYDWKNFSFINSLGKKIEDYGNLSFYQSIKLGWNGNITEHTGSIFYNPYPLHPVFSNIYTQAGTNNPARLIKNSDYDNAISSLKTGNRVITKELYVNSKEERLLRGSEFLIEGEILRRSRPNTTIEDFKKATLSPVKIALEESDVEVTEERRRYQLKETERSQVDWKLEKKGDDLLLTYTGPPTNKMKKVRFSIRFDLDPSLEDWAQDTEESSLGFQLYITDSSNDLTVKTKSNFDIVSRGFSISQRDQKIDGPNQAATFYLALNRDYQELSEAQINFDRLDGLKDMKVTGVTKSEKGGEVTNSREVKLSEAEIKNLIQEIKDGKGNSKTLKFKKKIDHLYLLELTGTLDTSTIELENPNINIEATNTGVTESIGPINRQAELSFQVPRYVFTNEPLKKQSYNDVFFVLNPLYLKNEVSELVIDFNDIELGGYATVRGGVKGIQVREVTNVSGEDNWKKGPIIQPGSPLYPTITLEDHVLRVKIPKNSQPIELKFNLAPQQPYAAIKSGDQPYRYKTILHEGTQEVRLSGVKQADISRNNIRLEQDSIFKNVVNYYWEVPPLKDAYLVGGGQRFAFYKNYNERFIIEKIGVTDYQGNEIPATDYSVAIGNSNEIFVDLIKDQHQGIKVKVPMLLSEPSSLKLRPRSYFTFENLKYIYLQSSEQAQLDVDFSLSNEDELMATNDLEIELRASHNQQTLGDAEFELHSNDGRVLETFKTNNQGKFTLKSVIVDNDYYLVQTKAPKGYVINPEYTGRGKKVTINKYPTPNKVALTNSLETIDVPLTVHFGYQKNLDLDDYEVLKITVQSESTINVGELPEVKEKLTEIQKTQNFTRREFQFDNVFSGSESELKIGRREGHVYYLFDGTVKIKEVPPTMSFDKGKISLSTQQLRYQGPDKFKIELNDTRLYNPSNQAQSIRGKLDLQAKVTTGFHIKGTPPAETEPFVIYYHNGQENKAITELSTTIYKKSVANKLVKIPVTLDDLSKQDDQGLHLSIPRGRQLKNSEYNAVVTFDVIAGP